MSAVVLENISKTFLGGKRVALHDINAEIPLGKITGVFGPDGAGKTTLLRILACLMKADTGSCTILGYDSEEDSDTIRHDIGYLPQKCGLYEDLTVSQNISLYTKLQGVKKEKQYFNQVIESSGLKPFFDRRVGLLSGGMKQKLSLMILLFRKPRILILDEPTVGLDPIIQKDLWDMFIDLHAEGMTIIASSSYLYEADQCQHSILLSKGKIIYEGPPDTFKNNMKGKTYAFFGIGELKRTIVDKLLRKKGIIDAIVEGDKALVTFETSTPDRNPVTYGLSKDVSFNEREPRFEDAVISALGGVPKRPPLETPTRKKTEHPKELMVEAVDLTKFYGDFKAVDHVSFGVKQGEIFGLLGPNGAGKSSIFNMLVGLIKPTDGEAFIGGICMKKAPRQARRIIGYVGQKFSLYDHLTVMQNLRFFCGIYPVQNSKYTIREMMEVFDLFDYQDMLTKDLPLGYKQRLALSCSLMHHPNVLFLDEPTAGVDSLTRREFWHQINLLAATGVSVVVTTHLMSEAEYCDRIGFIHQGKLLVIDTPFGIKKRIPKEISRKPTIKDAFMYLCSEKKEERG